MQTIEGDLRADGHRYAIIVSRWNGFFAEQLLAGARDTLVRHGAREEDLTVVRCPGSFEIPQVADRLARRDAFDAIVCLGVLIRGATPHFDYIASEATKGIGAVATEHGVVVTYGVITCDTLEQAVERSGSKAGNKGAEAAEAAIEMVNLGAAIDEQLS
jgi:6,7-dimethyl-8-ribityllumazine synthase